MLRKWGVWLVVIVLTLLAGLYLLRSMLIAPHLVTFLEHAIASNLGLQVSIGHLGGTYFSNVEIKNVTTVKRSTEGPVVFLKLRRLKLKYHPLDLLKGLPTFLAGSNMELDGVSLELNLSKTADTANNNELLAGELLLQQLPKITVSDSYIRIHGRGYETSLQGISLTARHQGSTTSRIRFQIAEWSWSHPKLDNGSVDLDADFLYADGRLIFTHLSVGKHSLIKSATIDLKDLPEKMSFEARLNLAGGQIETNGRLEKTQIQVQMAGNDIDLSRISGLLASNVPPFSGIFSVRGKLNLSLTTLSEMEANLEIQVAGGALNNETIDRFAIKLTADKGYIRISDLAVVSRENRVVIHQASVPAAPILAGDVKTLIKSVEAKWELDCTDVPSLLKLLGVSQETSREPIPNHRLILSGRMKSGNITIPDGRLELDRGHVRLKSALVSLPVGDRSFADSPVTAELELDLPDLKPLSLIFALPQLEGSLHGSMQVAGTLADPYGSASFTAKAITYRDTVFGDLSVNALADRRRVVIESLVLNRANDRVLLSGALFLESQRLDDVKVTINIADMAVYTHPWLQGNESISGSIKGSLEISGDFREPEARMNIRIENLRANDTHMENIILQLKNSGRRLEIELAKMQSSAGQMQLIGSILRNPTDTEFDLQLEKLTLLRQDTLLQLEQPARVGLNRKGMAYFDSLALGGSVGRLVLDGRFDPEGKSDLLITATSVRSDGWFNLVAPDHISFQDLNAQIRFSGRPDSPTITATGSLDSLGSFDLPMAFSGRFDLAYSGQKLIIRQFSWTSEDKQQISLTGNLPLNPFGPNLFPIGPIDIVGRMEISDASALNFLIPRYGLASGAIEGDFKLAGNWMRPLGKLNLRINNLNQPTDIRHLPAGPYDLTCAVRIEGDRVLLDDLQAQSPGLKVSVSGKWSDAPFPADLLRSKKQMLTGELDLEGWLDIPDLSWLARDVESVRRVAGRLEARGKLQGPITAPNADVTIRLSEGELSPDFDMPSLLALNMEAHISPKKMRIQKLTGELGGSPFTLAGILDVSASSESKTSLQLQGKDLLLFRNESLKLRADTDLTLKGEFSRLELAGEIAVTDGRFSKNLGLIEGVRAPVKPSTGGGFQLFSIKEPPFSNMVFNVRITSKEPIHIRNNLARGGIRPDLVLSGTGELPVLEGMVYVEPTRLYLPAGRMKLESGLVRFESSDPDHPKLDLVGTSSMLGYDITAVIEGPYNEPVVTLSSVPPLPDDELLMLLLAGQPPKKGGNRTGARSQHLNVAVFLGRDMIARLFGSNSEETEESILDRFDVEVGRRVTRQGEDTIHAEFRVADNVLRDKDSLYLTGERDVFDAYNLGVKIVFRFR